MFSSKNGEKITKITLAVVRYPILIHAFFYIRNTFYKQHDAEIPKNQAKAKQHSEAELLLFENCSFLHSCYHPKLI